MKATSLKVYCYSGSLSNPFKSRGLAKLCKKVVENRRRLLGEKGGLRKERDSGGKVEAHESKTDRGLPLRSKAHRRCWEGIPNMNCRVVWLY
jgi:hypothetical protein